MRHCRPGLLVALAITAAGAVYVSRATAPPPPATIAVAADAETGSYASVRRSLTRGQLPTMDAVRIEELINAFTFDYPLPHDSRPFAIATALAEAPWNRSHRLALIALQARRAAESQGTPAIVAKDVTLQIELNTQVVSAYRLIGYENTNMGDLRAGRSITVLYELVPVFQEPEPEMPQRDREKHLRCGLSWLAIEDALTVQVRYTQPGRDAMEVVAAGVRNESVWSKDLGFAAAVAEFGMLLRDSEFKGESSFTQARDLATGFKGDDHDGHRAEFIRLIGAAEGILRLQTKSP
jgi:Uncharacterized protein YfbK, C-terminal/von Willebrand factor